MKKICKYFFETVVILLFSGGLLWLLGPYEDADLSAVSGSTKLDVGVDAYFASVEARFDGIAPGVQKQAIWAAAPEAKTPWSGGQLRGFSATAQEIRPVPDQVAQAQLGLDDEPFAHIITGDILPPSPNPSMVQGILDWGKEL